MVSDKGKILSANPAICALLDYTENELKTKTFQEFTHPEDVQFEIELVKECLLGERDGYDMPKRYITKFGKIIYILLRVITVRNSHGDFLYFLSQVTPLSHVKLQNSQEGMDQAMQLQHQSAVKKGMLWFIGRYWERLLLAFFFGLISIWGLISKTLHN